MPSAPQQPPAATTLVGHINRLEAIVASQTQAITAQDHLHGLHAYEDRMPAWDGTYLTDFHEWLLEITLISEEVQGAVMLAMARGPLQKTLQAYINAVPGQLA